MRQVEQVRRHRGALVVTVLVVGLLALVTVLQLNSATHGGDTDPQNPQPEGARAVARVLASQGVDVDVVRGQAAFLDSQVGEETTVLVANATELGTSTLTRLEDHSRDAGALVLVDPGTSVLRAYGLRVAGLPEGTYGGSCADDLLAGLRAQVPDTVGFAGRGCLGDGSTRLEERRGSTRVLATASLLRNDTVGSADNAAIALRLLGQHPRLVWYVADSADTTAGDAVSITTLLPRWLVPGLWLLALVVLAAILVRGRRLGALVAEPLPVVVRAAETTRSRGRLYRRSHDREHAAQVLRAATRRRLARRVAVDAGDPGAVWVAVAAVSGRDLSEVRALLEDGPVPDDAQLVRLGQDLRRIETEVTHR